MRGVILIALLLLAPTASAQTIGDWRLTTEGKYSEAFTTSDSGGTFGLICAKSDGSCFYYVTMPATCEDGITVPLLVNADGGSLLLTGKCSVVDTAGKKVHILTLSPYDDVRKGLQTGQQFGIAVPMVEGQFKVFRFSLNGSSYAIERANAAAAHPTGDQTL